MYQIKTSKKKYLNNRIWPWVID